MRFIDNHEVSAWDPKKPRTPLMWCAQHAWYTSVKDNKPNCDGKPHAQMTFVGDLPEFLDWVLDHSEEVLNER